MTKLITKQEEINVVSKDIPTTVAATSTPAVLITAANQLRDMESKRVTWEDGAFRTSNQALYAVLADCLSYAGELSTAQAKLRTAALEDFYKERGYKLCKDTPLMTRIVRAVFGGADRRRISTYSLVLRQAQKTNAPVAGLAQRIEENGGVQEIRLSQSATFVSPKVKAETAKSSFDELGVLATVKTEALSLLADAEFVGTECVLLAQQQADGSFVVRALVRSGAAISAAFTALYAQQKAGGDAVKAEREAANDANGALGKAA